MSKKSLCSVINNVFEKRFFVLFHRTGKYPNADSLTGDLLHGRRRVGGNGFGSYNFNFIHAISFFIIQTFYSTLKWKVPTDLKYHT